MKICISCGIEKAFEDFPPNKTKRDGLNPKCRDCYNQYMKEWYEKPENKSKQLSRAAISKEKARARSREFIWDYLLAHPCENCGETDPIVLEFDHIDESKKEYTVAKMLFMGIVSIKREISKCRVLCANCHRRRTAEQFETWRWARSGRSDGATLIK